MIRSKSELPICSDTAYIYFMQDASKSATQNLRDCRKFRYKNCTTELNTVLRIFFGGKWDKLWKMITLMEVEDFIQFRISNLLKI